MSDVRQEITGPYEGGAGQSETELAGVAPSKVQTTARADSAQGAMPDVCAADHNGGRGRAIAALLRANSIAEFASWADGQPAAIDGLLPLPRRQSEIQDAAASGPCGRDVAIFLVRNFQFMRDNAHTLLHGEARRGNGREEMAWLNQKEVPSRQKKVPS